MIRVRYDEITTLVHGNFPDDVAYPNITINQNNKTITSPEGTFPFIEIENDQQDNSKQMSVVGGIYQEYVKSIDVKLQEAKASKIAQVVRNRDIYMYSPVEYNGSIFINSEKSGANLQAAYTYIDEPINWLDINGGTVALTKSQVKDIIQLIITLRSYGYFKQSQLDKAINNCTTIAELNNININF
jgi:hypothetical protein